MDAYESNENASDNKIKMHIEQRLRYISYLTNFGETRGDEKAETASIAIATAKIAHEPTDIFILC
jgi:hypothetical protein